MLTPAALKHGTAGLVIDGAISDSDAIIEVGFPVFARGLSIKAIHKNHAGRIGAEIVCGGQAIRTGDVILGDHDELVLLRGEIENVIAASEAREVKEKRMCERIEARESTIDILQLWPALERLGVEFSRS